MSITVPDPGPAPAKREAIRPFTFEVFDAELTDLRRRIEATRWPDRETDPSQGVRLETIQALANYWAKDYDWRAFEKRFAQRRRRWLSSTRHERGTFRLTRKTFLRPAARTA
jgi:hypothetical protein